MMLMAGFSTSIKAADNNEKMPDMAFLEYLAELVEVDGELVGPMDMKSKDTNKAKPDEKKQTREQLESVMPKQDANNKEQEGGERND